MELLQLEYFYAVAKTQHVTHTAEQLHIAQPEKNPVSVELFLCR